MGLLATFWLGAAKHTRVASMLTLTDIIDCLDALRMPHHVEVLSCRAPKSTLWFSSVARGPWLGVKFRLLATIVAMPFALRTIFV